jgi:tRNA nucleotidyltransferase (CCA-adding enzyme)
MTPNDYLQRILERQALREDGPELSALRNERGKIEAILRDAFGSKPTIKYGGSKAKGTMILLSYDLDILCYFPLRVGRGRGNARSPIRGGSRRSGSRRVHD